MGPKAFVRAIDYYLPEQILTNDDLVNVFSEWTSEKISSKTGIDQRHIASESECASDLAVKAAKKLFSTSIISPQEIDYVLLCTQSPDYFLPTTACLVQDRLGLPRTVGALDFNLGCSGYIYGLGLAKGLIETGQAKNILLLTAETYSKFIHPKDRSVRTLFGDAAAVTLLQAVEDENSWIGPMVYGTDGTGAENLIVKAGGLRQSLMNINSDRDSQIPTEHHLHMNGPEIVNFTLDVVPAAVARLLEKSNSTMEDYDLFVFHQANKYMLDHLRKKLTIPAEKFFVSMSHCGNTVSATIPIALHEAQRIGALKHGHRIMLVGFGVGYSWGATTLQWHASN